MKSAAIINFNDILTPLYSTFAQNDLSDFEHEDKRPDCLITWTDYPQDMRMISLSALQVGIPVFMVQHGRRAMRDYWTHVGEPSALAAFVWGTKDVADAIEGKWDKTRIFRVGAPWFSFRPERAEERGLVVYDVPHWNIDTIESKKTWTALKHIKGIRAVAKMIKPSEQKENNYLGEQCITYRNEPGHLEATFDLLKRASAVVCMMESTIELMAMSLGIPVVHVNGFKHKELAGTWQGVEDTLPGKGSFACDVEELEKTLALAMDHPEIKAQEAHERLLEDAGDPEKDTPTQSITTIIGQLIDAHKASDHKPMNMFEKESHEEANPSI